MTSTINDRRAKLQNDRQKIQDQIDQIQHDEQQETASGQTDTAHEWENADVRDGLLNAAEQELKQIDADLQRIDLGTYGFCEVCGEPIAEKRLDVLLYDTRCIKCADS
jgi:RNA polymerase-binding transcription factor DksA